MNAQPPILKLENLSKRYGDHQVLQGISLEITQGEIKALIGPSGGGKSTLLHCINFLVQMDEGRIWLRDQEITADNKQALYAYRQKVGMIFQDFNLFDHLTALHNVQIGLVRVRKMDRAAGAQAGPGRAGPGRLARSHREIPGRTVRRAETAGLHCPCPGHGPGNHAARRADLLPGPGVDRGGARRDSRPGRPGNDHDSGDPPGRLCRLPGRRDPFHGRRDALSNGARPRKSFFPPTATAPGSSAPRFSATPRTASSDRGTWVYPPGSRPGHAAGAVDEHSADSPLGGRRSADRGSFRRAQGLRQPVAQNAGRGLCAHFSGVSRSWCSSTCGISGCPTWGST